MVLPISSTLLEHLDIQDHHCPKILSFPNLSAGSEKRSGKDSPYDLRECCNMSNLVYLQNASQQPELLLALNKV